MWKIEFAGKEVKNPALRTLIGMLSGVMVLLGMIFMLIAMVLAIFVIPLSFLLYPLDRLRMKLFKSKNAWIVMKFR